MEIAYEKEAESEKSGQRDSFASFYYISFWYFRGGCFFRRAKIIRRNVCIRDSEPERKPGADEGDD